MITLLRDIKSKISGMVKLPQCRRVDLEVELQPGRLILLDSGMHQPIREYASYMANLGTLAHRRTVEIRSWGYSSSRSAYRERYAKDYKTPLLHYAAPSGSYSVVDRKIFELDGKRVSEFDPYDSRNPAVERVNPAFAQELEASITTDLKTLVSLYYCMNRDPGDMEAALVESIDIGIAAVEKSKAEGREIPVFIIDVMKGDDSPAIRDALKRLKDAGAPVLVVYTVSRPCPMTDLPSDLHMIERYELKTRFDDEVMLSTGEIVVIAEYWTTDIPQKGRRPRWWPDDKIGPLQTVSQYNEIQRKAA